MWCIGNGEDVNFWKDKWVGDCPIEEIIPRENISNHNLMVSDVIYQSRKS